MTNDEILEHIDRLGGGSVWEDGINTVGLHDVAVSDEEARPLCQLVGVVQIALDVSRLSYATAMSIASIPRLKSFVMFKVVFSEAQIANIRSANPALDVLVDPPSG